jgi:DNA (cytosine-5)-methyltransferase 1
MSEEHRITIATDFSGIESPIMALKQLHIPFRHVWSCDNDKNVKKSILANYNPEIYFDDITTRDNTLLEKDIDLYVAGFPCQPFSSIGTRKGIAHTKGTLFWNVADTISHVLPKKFVLENVKGLLSNDKGRTFKTILDILKTFPYKVSYSMLNTKDFNLPHNRPRVFIVGIRNDIPMEFKFPEPQPLTVDILSLLDHDLPPESIGEKKQKILDELGIDQTKNYFVTPFSSALYCNPMLDILPCQTAGFSKRYSLKLKRYLTPREHARLQGFPDDFKIVVSRTEAYRQFGNTISVNVLCQLCGSLVSTRATTTSRGAVLMLASLRIEPTKLASRTPVASVPSAPSRRKSHRPRLPRTEYRQNKIEYLEKRLASARTEEKKRYFQEKLNYHRSRMN